MIPLWKKSIYKLVSRRFVVCDSSPCIISSTFYKQIFCAKVLCPAFLYLYLVFVFLAIGNWHKAARKMLVKLTEGEHTTLADTIKASEEVAFLFPSQLNLGNKRIMIVCKFFAIVKFH